MRFSRPKSPGYGISRNYYLTALACKASMPSILDIVNPNGQSGAVVGFGVPLAKDSSPESLARPLQRGAYALATKDRKTVVRCLVVSKEEAGFDPEALLDSGLAQDLGEEKIARVRAVWSLVQLAFETYDPSVDVSVDFLVQISVRVAQLTDGVVADAISQRYFLPEELSARTGSVRDDLAFHVSTIAGSDGALRTFGLQKFALPEFELSGVGTHELPIADRLLRSLCREALSGSKFGSGSLVGSGKLPFRLNASEAAGQISLKLEPANGDAGTSLRDWDEFTED